MLVTQAINPKQLKEHFETFLAGTEKSEAGAQSVQIEVLDNRGEFVEDVVSLSKQSHVGTYVLNSRERGEIGVFNQHGTLVPVRSTGSGERNHRLEVINKVLLAICNRGQVTTFPETREQEVVSPAIGEMLRALYNNG